MTLFLHLLFLHLVLSVLLQKVKNFVNSGRSMHALCVWRFEALLYDLQRVVVHVLTLIISGNCPFWEGASCLAPRTWAVKLVFDVQKSIFSLNCLPGPTWNLHHHVKYWLKHTKNSKWFIVLRLCRVKTETFLIETVIFSISSFKMLTNLLFE